MMKILQLTPFTGLTEWQKKRFGAVSGVSEKA
jgi:hypothetical protein